MLYLFFRAARETMGCIKPTLQNRKLQAASLPGKHSMPEAGFDAMCCTRGFASRPTVGRGINAVNEEKGAELGMGSACKADACFKGKRVWAKRNTHTALLKLSGSSTEDEFVLVQSLFLRGCRSCF